jgi:sugar O-acyltransferase (sialic acid O-acetyltransferase NeuD family)
MRKLCIVGVGGTTKDLLDLLARLNETLPPEDQWTCIGILDDNSDLHGSPYAGVPVIGKLADAASLENDVFFAFSIGSPRTGGNRKTIFERLGVERHRFPSLIHPKALVEAAVPVGQGTIVFAGTVVSGSAVLGEFNIVLPGCVINHDSTLGDFTCLASGVCISGNVAVGDDAYIGANAALRDGIRVGDDSLIGLGSAVTPSATYPSVEERKSRRMLQVC